MNSASRNNWIEPSSSTISTEALFNGDSNEETLNVKKIVLAILEKNGIQNIFKYYLPQYRVLQKILERVFITKKFI